MMGDSRKGAKAQRTYKLFERRNKFARKNNEFWEPVFQYVNTEKVIMPGDFVVLPDRCSLEEDFPCQFGPNVSKRVVAVYDRTVRPAFLVPASEAFCTLEVLSVRRVPFREIPHDKTTVGPEWYKRRYTGLTDETLFWVYEFRRWEA